MDTGLLVAAPLIAFALVFSATSAVVLVLGKVIGRRYYERVLPR